MDELDLYPSYATIGGNDYGAFTITDGYGNPVDPAGLYPSSMTIGGNDYGTFTITDGYGNPVDPAGLYPSSMTIGGTPSYGGGDLMSSLLQLYAMAPPGSVEQAQIVSMIDSVNGSTAVWTLPDSSDVDGDLVPDWNDPYVPYGY